MIIEPGDDIVIGLREYRSLRKQPRYSISAFIAEDGVYDVIGLSEQSKSEYKVS